MKLRLSLILILLFGAVFTSRVLAQEAPRTAAEAAADLRAQLADVQAREADLKARLNQLDEALQPENIERSLAGIGSTRPEELREQRRRELTIEKDGVRRQLELLATSRARLESAIQVADNGAYQQSARGFYGYQFDALRLSSISPRRVVIATVIFFGLLGIGGLAVFIRRR
jgi:hypothetical protein